MKHAACLALFCAVLTGCSQDPPATHPDSASAADENTQKQNPDAGGALPDLPNAWAHALIASSERWEPVTAEAVPAHVMNFGLCRLPIPGVDDHGPHGASLSHFLATKDPEATPKRPANQFIVNPIGRSQFYDVSGQVDKVAAVPPPLPVGTVIIKEKYEQIEDAKQRTNPHSFGVMTKREPGYDPEHGDWEYAYIEVDASRKITSATRGKLATCIDCHANRKQTDYVFRGYPLMPPPR